MSCQFVLLVSDSQQIISQGWPGLVSLHLEVRYDVSTSLLTTLKMSTSSQLIRCSRIAHVSFSRAQALTILNFNKLSIPDNKRMSYIPFLYELVTENAISLHKENAISGNHGFVLIYD